MVEEIRKCQRCGLCQNQKPLLDSVRDCQLFWVGLSAKKVISDTEKPLSPKTNTGKLIQQIEMCAGVATYKTNLVKCPPLTEKQKLRYPNKKEISCCIGNLMNEIRTLSPQIVFLLGEKVYSSVEAYFGIQFEKWNGFDYHYKEYKGVYYVPVQHPSYIYVYKRKVVNQYVRSIEETIENLL